MKKFSRQLQVQLGQDAVLMTFFHDRQPSVKVLMNGMANSLQRRIDTICSTHSCNEDSFATALVQTCPEVTLYEQRDLKKDLRDNVECSRYLFQVLLGKNWKREACYAAIDKPLRDLLKKGYIFPRTPAPGDIVAYGYCDDFLGNIPQQLLHVGLLLKNGLVRSKWCQGNVFDHPVHGVDSQCGNQALFLRAKA